MKKIIILVIGVLMLFSVSALGEDPIKLVEGVYSEGQEIESGIYSFVCDSTDAPYCVVATFVDEEHYENFTNSKSVVDGLKDNTIYYWTLSKKESCDVKIEYDNLLLVLYGEGTLTLRQRLFDSKEDESDTSNTSYEALLSTLKSTQLTSGEKLMARINYWAEDRGDMAAAINLYESSMTAMGYDIDQIAEILLRAQVGEELHPFHRVEYDTYNMPAKQNGLEDDTILVDGVIREYIADGGKKNCSYGMIVEQEDGDRWLIYCAEKIDGTLIGKWWGKEPEQHVFEGYDERNVMIYGKYLGFSDKYNLPVIDIVKYGGMVLTDENVLIMTMTSAQNMRSYGGVHDFEFLLGASSKIESTERYYGR